MVALIAAIILPRFATLVPTYTVYLRIGWVGTWLPLIVPHFFANAFNVFLLQTVFLTIPRSSTKQPPSTGLGRLRTCVGPPPADEGPDRGRIPVHFYFAWNDFFEPLILSLSARPELQPIAVGLRTFNTLYDDTPSLSSRAQCWP